MSSARTVRNVNMTSTAEAEDKKITYSQKLFPPLEEPIFQLEETCNFFLLSEDARLETLNQLKAKNKKNTKRRIIKNMRPFLALSGDTVYTTFHMCDFFQLSAAVKYLALDIFDRFFMRHMEVLIQTMNKKSDRKKAGSNNDEWFKLIERITRQSLLRLLSCIQLASKITDRNKVLCPAKIRDYLKQNKLNFSIASIVSSEARVALTLNYELDVLTAYTVLENLLALRRSPLLLQVAPQIFSLGVHLLEMLYLRHVKIYDMLFQCIGIGTPVEDNEDGNNQWQVELRRMRCELDNLWAGAAVIIAALHHVNIGLQELAIEELAIDLKGVRCEHELRAFAWVINKCFSAEPINES